MTPLDVTVEGADGAPLADAPVRLAIVGTGGIGRLHAELAATVTAVELVGLSSLDEAAADLANSLGAPLSRNYRALLELEPEAVIVATPNATHLEIGGFFAAAGIPVLVEKPIAENLRAARELCDIAEQAGIPLLVGHHRRHHRLVREAARFVDSEVGKLVATSTLVTMRKPDSYYEVEWRRGAGAGPLLVNLIHEVDLLRAVCGEIEGVQAASARLARDFAFDDTATVLFHFAGGAMGTLVISESTPSPWSWEATVSDGMGFHNAGQDHAWFVGTEASLSFPSLTAWRYDASDPDPGWQSPLMAHRLTPGQLNPYRRVSGSSPGARQGAQNPYVAQIENLAGVVKGREHPLVTGEDGLRNLAVVDAVSLAARSGDLVKIDELLDA